MTDDILRYGEASKGYDSFRDEVDGGSINLGDTIKVYRIPPAGKPKVRNKAKLTGGLEFKVLGSELVQRGGTSKNALRLLGGETPWSKIPSDGPVEPTV